MREIEDTLKDLSLFIDQLVDYGLEKEQLKFIENIEKELYNYIKNK